MGCRYPEASGLEATVPALSWQHHSVSQDWPEVEYWMGPASAHLWPRYQMCPGTEVLKIFEESQSTVALGVTLWEDVMPGSRSLNPIPSWVTCTGLVASRMGQDP